MLHITLDEYDRWNVIDSKMIDFSSVKGTWVNCFGTVTPWGTPISSEELYFDDTENWHTVDNEDTIAHYKT